MSLFTQMIQLQMQIVLMLGIGFFLRKKEIVTAEIRKGLSALLINVVLPCTVILSFMNDSIVNSDLLMTCLLAVVISAIIQTVSIIASKFLFNRYEKMDANVLTYGMIVSNSAFIGIPIIQSIYGSEAVMFASVFQIPIIVTMWTIGLALFKPIDHKHALQSVIRNPSVVAVLIGFIIMLTGIKFPIFIEKTISSIASCTTAISMFVVGSILSDIEWNNLLDKKVLFFCSIRLIAYPFIVFIVLTFANAPTLIKAIAVIMTGMPAGSTAAILAEQYGCDAKFAAKLILVSTALSVITIPILCLGL
ncbi:AEC family transporter [Solobacterium moorei]|uniref:AEC family transporter n=1 Tax=Solobacterium moorei TaxID=102148 RepID=UPI0004190563|nr:AEC family transporter [Solobacterium moorei]BET21859.1 AEC family transporter [Solobacterium moorei]